MNQFTITGDVRSSFLTWFIDGVKQKFSSEGYEYCEDPVDNIRIVFNVLDNDKPRPFRRKAQATFVVSVIEAQETPKSTFEAAYPYLIRSLSNHLIYILHKTDETDIYFVTPEQGFYKLTYESDSNEVFFHKVYERLSPVASSQLVINNNFNSDLEKGLWDGNPNTEKMYISGKKLDSMNLLPAPFPLEDYLTSRDMRQLNKLYGIGGLSYGNLSCRENDKHFWMSASGVNKANLQVIGKDLLYITGFNPENKAMDISVPPDVSPKRASVDAIEHWMIYMEHPEVGAIVHIHGWIDGVQATEVNYPCGTIELAETVAELVRHTEDPSRAIIGLKNHGLTITGRDLDDIFERIDGQVVSQVPMSS